MLYVSTNHPTVNKQSFRICSIIW